MKSFRCLLWKEWLGLRPFAILALGLFIVGLFLAFFTEFLDEYPIWHGMFKNVFDSSVLMLILSAVVGRGLAIREKDDGSIRFIDGLPVSRVSVFCAKWLVAVIILVVLHLAWNIEVLIYDWMSRTSVSEPVPWFSVLKFIGYEIFLIGFFVSAWCAISCFRRWDLLILGCVFMLVRWMLDKQIPYVDWINPLSLIKPPSKENMDVWPIPWGHVLTLATMGCVFWGAGLLFFCAGEGFLSRTFRVVKETWWGKTLGCIPLLLVPIVWIGILFTSDSAKEAFKEDQEKSEKAAAKKKSASNGISEIRTVHFIFIFREEIKERLDPVIKSADKSLIQVLAFLEAPADLIKGEIVVDLSSPIGDHNAGQAYWKKIRMTLPTKYDAKDNIAVLGHEVTHVIIDQITDGRASDSFETTRWFHEGLASYVEHEFFGKAKRKENMTRWTALATTWDEIKFRELIRNSVFTAKRDSNAVYPAGREWIYALVDVYGEEAPAKMLKAMGRKDAPKKILGLTFWRDVCLSAEFDMERINARFRERLSALREKYAEDCKLFPEITKATVTRENGNLVIRPDLSKVTIPSGSKLLCRVRQDKDAEPWKMHQSVMGKDKAFHVSGLYFLGPEVDFQIGWLPGKWLSLPVMGAWTHAVVKKPSVKK